MLKNSIYSTNSLETLLLQNSLNTANTFSSSLNSSSMSYDTMLKSIKDSLEKKSALKEADNEISELEEKFEKELKQLRTETAIYDMFHNAYITNGIFSDATKSKLRTQKYNAWNNIFSMQAERVQAQTQIALQSLMRRNLHY